MMLSYEVSIEVTSSFDFISETKYDMLLVRDLLKVKVFISLVKVEVRRRVAS